MTPLRLVFFSFIYILLLSIQIQNIQSEGGFHVTYFDCEDATDWSPTAVFSVMKTFQRQESSISLQDGQPLNPPDDFKTKRKIAARFYSTLSPPEDGLYQFFVEGDDGVHLSLDSIPILSDWKPGKRDAPRASQKISLLTGEKYKFRVELFQNAPNSKFTITWVLPSSENGTPTPLPATAFTPLSPEQDMDLQPTIDTDSQGWRTQYFKSSEKNLDLSREARFRHPNEEVVTPSVDFPDWADEWGSEITPSLTKPNYFAARFTGLITPPKDDKYRLVIRADDGVRVTINGRPLIAGSSWNQVHEAQDFIADVNLVENADYQIVVEYFQLLKSATTQLFWESSTIPRQIIPSTVIRPSIYRDLNVVPFNGFNYAVLDGTDQDSEILGTQPQFLPLPEGW
jgi:hypothetical protein